LFGPPSITYATLKTIKNWVAYIVLGCGIVFKNEHMIEVGTHPG